MLGGEVDAAILVAALGAGPPPPSAAGAAAPTVGQRHAVCLSVMIAVLMALASKATEFTARPSAPIRKQPKYDSHPSFPSVVRQNGRGSPRCLTTRCLGSAGGGGGGGGGGNPITSIAYTYSARAELTVGDR